MTTEEETTDLNFPNCGLRIPLLPTLLKFHVGGSNGVNIHLTVSNQYEVDRLSRYDLSQTQSWVLSIKS